jgi:hypothetical protein
MLTQGGGGGVEAVLVGCNFFLKNTLYISRNFTPLTSFPLFFFILEHTKTVNLFTQVLTINKYRSTAKLLESQIKFVKHRAKMFGFSEL